MKTTEIQTAKRKQSIADAWIPIVAVLMVLAVIIELTIHHLRIEHDIPNERKTETNTETKFVFVDSIESGPMRFEVPIEEKETSITDEVAREEVDIPEALNHDSLKLAIENTLFSKIDPGAFLETALELSKLEISLKPIPEPDVSGAMRYPILGTPDGVNAELWVRYSTNPDLKGPLLEYHVNVDSPKDYMLAGTSRNKLEAQIFLWNNKEGGVGYFGVSTDARVSGRTPGWDKGELPTGVSFVYDPKKPNEWHASDSILRNGGPVDSSNSPAVQGVWPRTNDLTTLQQAMLAQYGKVK